MLRSDTFAVVSHHDPAVTNCEFSSTWALQLEGSPGSARAPVNWIHTRVIPVLPERSLIASNLMKIRLWSPLPPCGRVRLSSHFQAGAGSERQEVGCSHIRKGGRRSLFTLFIGGWKRPPPGLWSKRWWEMTMCRYLDRQGIIPARAIHLTSALISKTLKTH